MATYTDAVNVIWTFDDDKLSFDNWIAADVARSETWGIAGTEHNAWLEANPGLRPQEHNGRAATIWMEWATYANVVQST
jgi:hypothetical protein